MTEKEPVLDLDHAVGTSRIRVRVNLTHNSKGTNIDTTAEVDAESPDALEAAWGLRNPDRLIAALLRSAFVVGAYEAQLRGKPVEQVPALDGFSELPPLSLIQNPDEVPF